MAMMAKSEMHTVHDESADENTIVLSKSFDWIIEGVEELDEGKIRHMNAFYALLKKWMRGKEYTSKAPRTLVRARKPIGYVVRAVTGTTTNARINMMTIAMRMLTAVNNNSNSNS